MTGRRRGDDPGQHPGWTRAADGTTGPDPGPDPGSNPANDPAGASRIPGRSPEARRAVALAGQADAAIARRYMRARSRRRAVRVIRRIWAGVINDGTIHAGNFAYMVLISLFPFFVTGAALFSLLGQSGTRGSAMATVLDAMPRDVASVLDPVARGVLAGRTGSLLWIGGVVGLWTVGSLVETIRDLLRRAYGTGVTRAYWRRRLASTGLIIASVVLILVAITIQVAVATAQETLVVLAPQLDGWITGLALSRFAPTPVLFAALWILFMALCPPEYRGWPYPKWPGALFVTAWWQGITIALPKLMRTLFTYDLTYGSLAGVMIALFFFWLVGLGMVIGAELNAALAETPEERDLLGLADDR